MQIRPAAVHELEHADIVTCPAFAAGDLDLGFDLDASAVGEPGGARVERRSRCARSSLQLAHQPAADSLPARGREEAYYGLESVELVPAPPARGRLLFGELVGPGQIRLYDQPLSPWRLLYALSKHARAELQTAGADHSEDGLVTSPADSLRRYMLGYVLAHELGHHVLQHERRVRGERAARTREHEARAEVVATRLRELLD
jgi:hypothetical protein